MKTMIQVALAVAVLSGGCCFVPQAIGQETSQQAVKQARRADLKREIRKAIRSSKHKPFVKIRLQTGMILHGDFIADRLIEKFAIDGRIQPDQAINWSEINWEEVLRIVLEIIEAIARIIAVADNPAERQISIVPVDPVSVSQVASIQDVDVRMPVKVLKTPFPHKQVISVAQPVGHNHESRIDPNCVI